MNEKTYYNTLFESPCIKQSDLNSLLPPKVIAQNVLSRSNDKSDPKFKYFFEHYIIDERSEYSTGEKKQFLYGLLLSTAVT